MEPIKVVVIEDNRKFREIIHETIGLERDMEICDEAENLKQAKEILAKRPAHVALLDLSIDEYEGGLKFLQEIRTLNLPTDFIILSAHTEAIYSAKSIQAGAKGYLCKDKIVPCLAKAIRSVRAHRQFVS